MIEKISQIKKSHKGNRAELINKVARLVAYEKGMDKRMAEALAMVQVGDWKGLNIAR